MERTIRTVGVIDKAVGILSAVETEPQPLAGLVEQTGLTRATAHRLAAALVAHGLLRRDAEGRFALGPRVLALGQAAERGWPIAAAAGPALTALRDETGESAQLYVRDGAHRVCVASLESPHGLRTIVETGASLPLDRGSGGRALAGEDDGEGWVVSVGERQAGVASVSAPIIDGAGNIRAAVSVSGPIERLSHEPGATYGPPVRAAAHAIVRAAGLASPA